MYPIIIKTIRYFSFENFIPAGQFTGKVVYIYFVYSHKICFGIFIVIL